MFKVALTLIRLCLRSKSKTSSALKKKYPTMYETLEALRNPPTHLLEEDFLVTQVSWLCRFIIRAFWGCFSEEKEECPPKSTKRFLELQTVWKFHNFYRHKCFGQLPQPLFPTYSHSYKHEQLHHWHCLFTTFSSHLKPGLHLNANDACWSKVRQNVWYICTYLYTVRHLPWQRIYPL